MSPVHVHLSVTSVPQSVDHMREKGRVLFQSVKLFSCLPVSFLCPSVSVGESR